MTNKSMEEVLNETGEVIVGSDKPYKPGEILKGYTTINNGQDKPFPDVPLAVLRECTREEFVAQDPGLVNNKKYPYYYAVTTD